MKKLVLISFTLIFLISNFYVNAQEIGSFKDKRDGKVYKTVKIGNQIWLAENFKYQPERGYFVSYDVDTANIRKHGYLYSWKTAMDIVPEGWRLPTKEDFQILANKYGGDSTESAYLALIENGKSNFNAQLSGADLADDGFYGMGIKGCYWTSTKNSEYPDDYVWSFNLNKNKKIAYFRDQEYRYHSELYVRLVKDIDNKVNHNWKGAWQTNWGENEALMSILTFDDNSVSGTYEHKQGEISGEYKEKDGKSFLEGTWEQYDGKGWFVFTMSENGKYFKGEWGDAGDKSSKGNWNGTKVLVSYTEKTGDKLLKLPYSAEFQKYTYEESLEKWEDLKKEHGNSYIYQRKFDSWSGFGRMVQIKVVDGVVVSRIYQSYKRTNSGNIKVDKEYKETGEDVGKHEGRFPAITIDELYVEGKKYLEVDEEQNKIYFTTFENGLLKFCGHYPNGCVDDCFNGVSIYSIRWIK